MNAYLKQLEQLLQQVPEKERVELLEDYREHFRLALAEGKSEEEVAGALGDPRMLAEEILAEYGLGNGEPENAAVEPVPARTRMRRKRIALVSAGAALVAVALMAGAALRPGRGGEGAQSVSVQATAAFHLGLREGAIRRVERRCVRGYRIGKRMDPGRCEAAVPLRAIVLKRRLGIRLPGIFRTGEGEGEVERRFRE